MEYNSTREHLRMPEYGRMIQTMVDHAVTIADPRERQHYAEATVSVMMGLNPKMKDVPDFRHKIWDHLAYISDYKLDIRYPYPIEHKSEGMHPDKLDYPKHRIRFRHYGMLLEKAMEKLSATTQPREREVLTRLIANRMKRNLADWKGDGVDDEKVAHDITFYTDGAVNPDFSRRSLMEITDNNFRTRKNKGGF